MLRVIIESPLAGDYEANRDYAKRCVLDSLKRGESPLASHLLYDQPGILDDTKPEQRELGIEAGLAWSAVADLAAVYVDLGISPGMKRGIERHKQNGLRIELRSIAEQERKQGVVIAMARFNERHGV